MNARLLLLFLLLAGPALQPAAGQTAASTFIKTITVADGLPQSFISGLVQDSTGFIWIGTKDGLARYDGVRFKLFRHFPGDTAGIANNRINSLFLDSRQGLWIAYETGEMDVLDTRTEGLLHLTRDSVFKPVQFRLRAGRSMAEDRQGAIWMLRDRGGLFRCNRQRRLLRFFPEEALGLQHNKAVSIAAYKGGILLIADTSLILLDTQATKVQEMPFPAQQKHLYDASRLWKSVQVCIRRNGDIFIKDDSRLIVYNPAAKSFVEMPLPPGNAGNVYGLAIDSADNIYFDHNAATYRLSAANELSLWRPQISGLNQGAISMLVDASGVLWIGGNATGLQLYDLRLPRLSGLAYAASFHQDVLQQALHVPAGEITRSFLPQTISYNLRWTADNAGGLWLLKAGQEATARPELAYYKDGHLTSKPWRFTDTLSAGHMPVASMAYSRSGKLWGVDFFLRPVYFDTAARTATVYSAPSVVPANVTPAYAVNSLVIDGEDTFWISTALNGLYRYDKRSDHVVNYTAGEGPGTLPTNQLMNMLNDPANPNILWIGSLSGGLIRFDKRTGRCRNYTTKDGLPNNTVYAVVADNNGLLWCSSNKGIFSFYPKTGAVSGFTSKDGLPGDEFNRYHFLKLPDGRIAFGGTEGYIVFNPADVAADSYEPKVALSGIGINNAAADFGEPGSPLTGAINSVDKITLNHNQNFLAFEFAALQFNSTEKLRYRYRLEGIDAQWIDAGEEHTAGYTSLPPGDYVFAVNATNTSGQWSRHVKKLRVIIRPPFWRTWWFASLCLVLAVGTGYGLVRRRIAGVRKEEQQKLEFEREASALKAQALQAQMNPHFIFNCLNSIKALIQEDRRQEAVKYLTSFSKLIRSQLNNAEREISLHEELETCRLYARMEALRFGDKIGCDFIVDEAVDTHALQVPALILQPFIENAIWHGVLPKGGGTISVSVAKRDGAVDCVIDDDGIGREASLRAKSQATATYSSKGMKLALGRMELYNKLHQQGGSIEVVDKKDGNGKPTGTRVVVTFKRP